MEGLFRTLNLSAADAVLLPDGKLLVAVGYSAAGFVLVRLTAAGQLDGTFGSGGVVTVDPYAGGNEQMGTLAVQPDGKIVLAGQYLPPAGGSGLAVTRLSAAGAFDTGFGSGGTLLVAPGSFGAFTRVEPYGLAVAPDGRLVVAGRMIDSGFNGSVMAVRLTAAGVLDTTFSGDGLFAQRMTASLDDQIYDLAVQPDGGVLLVGSAFLSPNGTDLAVARLTPAGAFDPAFDGDGIWTAPPLASVFEQMWAGELLADGRLVALGGYNEDMRVARLNVAGMVAAATLTVTDDEPVLTLTVAPPTFSEGAGATAATGTVTRTGSTAQAVTLLLSSNTLTAATVPASVTIPAGQTSATFPLSPVDEAVPDGDQTVTVSASLPGSVAAITGPFTYRTYSPPVGLVGAVATQVDGRILVASRTSGGDFITRRYNPLSGGGFEVDGGWGSGGAVTTDVSGGADTPRPSMSTRTAGCRWSAPGRTTGRRMWCSPGTPPPGRWTRPSTRTPSSPWTSGPASTTRPGT